MVEFVNGTVFSTPAKTLVNTVNCVGALGKGIALEFNLRYEGLEEEYKRRCEDKSLRIGRPALYVHNDDRWILNFPTKNHWRYPSKLEWIEDGLKYFVANYKRVEFESIAFPKLGCGNGKLDWAEVKPLMIKYLDDLEIKVYICLGETEFVDSTEQKMVAKINSSSVDYFSDNVGIGTNQSRLLYEYLPVGNVRDLLRIKGLGKTNYVKLFRYFYYMFSSEVHQTVIPHEKISLLDEREFNTNIEESY